MTEGIDIGVADLEELARSGASVTKECRAFRIRVDDDRFVVHSPQLIGKEILTLVDKCPPEWCLFQRFHGGERTVIEPDQSVDLTAPGVERFRTRKAIQLCIEDQFLPWCERTITTEQIAELGGWDPSLGVIEVDEDQNERTLQAGEVVKLRPGIEFGKKHCWKRG